MYFLELVIFWHFFSRLIRTCFDLDRKSNNLFWGVFLLTVMTFIAKLVWIFWFTEGIERSYGFTKHLFIWLYVIMQIVSGTNLGEMSQDFWYFLADAIILSQICSIFFLDELNFSIFNSFTPIVLGILSFLLVRGLSVNEADKTRLCLVKTVGKHDAVYLILLYSFVMLVLCTIDFFANSYWAALGLVFFFHALVIFPALMESKYAFAYCSSLIMAAGMGAVTLYVMFETPNPYPRPEGGEPEPRVATNMFEHAVAALRDAIPSK